MNALVFNEVSNWVPKVVLLFAVLLFGYACWTLIKYVVKTKHGEIMDKFSHLDRHLVQLRDNINHLTDKIDGMVTNEQHRESKRELKESLFEIKDQFHDKFEELRKRVQSLEERI